MVGRTPHFTQEARKAEILRLLRQIQRVEVTELTARFGVSDMTIRRDLAELQASGQIRRVHGGAVPARDRPHEHRADKLPSEKAAIGAAVANMIAAGEAVGIDIGTTCRAVADALAGRDDLFVVTHSLHAAIEFRHSASKVLVLGGLLTSELSLTGDPSPYLERLRLNTLILGCGGVTADQGLTYFDLAEVEVREALLNVSDRVILAADHTKLGQNTAIRLAALDVVDVLVTDEEPPRSITSYLNSHGGEVVVAGTETDHRAAPA